MKTKNWFIKKINKRIYRNKGTCECSTCKEVEKNGLIVMDENHAEYIFDVQNEQGLSYYEKNITT